MGALYDNVLDVGLCRVRETYISLCDAIRLCKICAFLPFRNSLARITQQILNNLGHVCSEYFCVCIRTFLCGLMCAKCQEFFRVTPCVRCVPKISILHTFLYTPLPFHAVLMSTTPQSPTHPQSVVHSPRRITTAHERSRIELAY